jgi:UTP--glucose-1-phosphate uridylyltransferase
MISTCLFPAAGYGTRFLPATKAVPKEMLPILTKPLLQFGVEEAFGAGIENMAIVTGRGKRAIEDHFDTSFELESQLIGTTKEYYLDEINNVIEKATFTYVRQRQMLGLGNAILTGEPLVGMKPFAVILADDLCDCTEKGVISQLISIYKEYQCSVIAIEEIPFAQAKNYGIISGDLIDGNDNTYRVTNMFEKPNSHNLIDFLKVGDSSKDKPNLNAIIGRYILTPDIFDILRRIKPGKNGEIQITDALLSQAKKGKVIAYKFKGKRFDCGNIIGYVDATNHFASKQGI